MRDGSLNLLAKNYTANELNCIRHLARSGHRRGTEHIRTTSEPRRLVRRPNSGVVRWKSCGAAARRFRRQLMYQVLVKLANERRESAAFVNGFTRTCYLFCQIGPGVTPIAERVFYNCMGEVTDSLRWPGVRDSNWLYRLLDLLPLRAETNDAYDAEYGRLLSCGVEDLYNLAPAVGSLLSAGFDLAMHYHKVTGKDLCRMASPNLSAQSAPLTGLSDYLFRGKPTEFNKQSNLVAHECTK